jgi:hypothetical protein
VGHPFAEAAPNFPEHGSTAAIFDHIVQQGRNCQVLVAASFEAGTLTVSLPPDAARRWGTSEEVEIRATLPLDGGTLELLIEKDFPCLTARPGEDDSDAFRRDQPLPDP